MLRFFFRLQIEWPRGGWPSNALLCANHASFFDPILVGAVYPRSVSYFARASLWKLPIVRQALDILGGLPVDRSAPQLDIMRRTVAWLKDGRNILIFPEGTRTKNGRLGRLQTGPAMFARRAKVPLQPIYLHRSADALASRLAIAKNWRDKITYCLRSGSAAIASCWQRTRSLVNRTRD